MPFGGLLTLGAIGAAGSLGGAGIGASASKSAADQQAQASRYATDIQNQQFQQTQANLAPYIQGGQQTLSQILAGIQPGGSLVTPYADTFKPPTNPNPAQYTLPTLEQAEQQPGYKFNLAQGDQGILNAQTAAGGAFNSGTIKSLIGYNQALGQNNYQQVVGNTQNQYQLNQNSFQQAYNNALNSFQTQYNTYNTNQANQYNRLASVAGLGQNSVNTLGQIGQQTAANIGNTVTSGAAAGAAGTVGAANAITGGLSGATNAITGGLTLSQILNGLNNQSSASNPALVPGNYPLPSGPGTPGYVDTTSGV